MRAHLLLCPSLRLSWVCLANTEHTDTCAHPTATATRKVAKRGRTRRVSPPDADRKADSRSFKWCQRTAWALYKPVCRQTPGGIQLI